MATAIATSKCELFIGKSCYVELHNREEQTFTGELLGADTTGVLMSYQEHGRNFIAYAPYSSIAYIEHKEPSESKEKEK